MMVSFNLNFACAILYLLAAGFWFTIAGGSYATGKRVSVLIYFLGGIINNFLAMVWWHIWMVRP